MTLLHVVAWLSIAQSASDSVAVYEGIVQQAQGGTWHLMLPYPVTVAGLRTRSLVLNTKTRLARRDGRVVRAHGSTATEGGTVVLHATRFEEVTPPWTVTRTIAPMFTQRAILAISAYPHEFAWRDSRGDSTGVAPALVFSLTNHGEVPLEVEFRTNDVVCATITPVDGTAPPWRYVWQGDLVNRRLTVALGSVVRWVVPIPPDATPDPGEYEGEATLCGAQDFRAATTFRVR